MTRWGLLRALRRRAFVLFCAVALGVCLWMTPAEFGALSGRGGTDLEYLSVHAIERIGDDAGVQIREVQMHHGRWRSPRLDTEMLGEMQLVRVRRPLWTKTLAAPFVAESYLRFLLQANDDEMSFSMLRPALLRFAEQLRAQSPAVAEEISVNIDALIAEAASQTARMREIIERTSGMFGESQAQPVTLSADYFRGANLELETDRRLGLYWPGVAWWLALGLCAALVVWALPTMAIRVRKLLWTATPWKTCCARCGSSLDGALDERCPKCHGAFRSERRKDRPDRRPTSVGAVRWRAFASAVVGLALLGAGLTYKANVPLQEWRYATERFNALFAEEDGRLVPVPDLAHHVNSPDWNSQMSPFGDAEPPADVVYWVQVLVNGSVLRARPFYDALWRQEAGVMVIRMTDTEPGTREEARSHSAPTVTLVTSVTRGPTQQAPTRFAFESLRGDDPAPYVAAFARALEADAGTAQRFIARSRDGERLPLANGDSDRMLQAALRLERSAIDVRWRGVLQNWFALAVVAGVAFLLAGVSRAALTWRAGRGGRVRCRRCLFDLSASHAESCPECGQRIKWPEAAAS